MVWDLRVLSVFPLIVVRPDDGHALGPLFVGDVKEPDIARRRDEGLNAVNVLAQLLQVDAGPGIHAELNHEEAVVEQVVAEPRSYVPQ